MRDFSVFMVRLYRLFNILSIDVAIGAMIGAAFFARLLGVAILPSGFAALGLTVWIIYTADHLIDARKVQRVASTERHRFHQRNMRWLFAAMVAALVVDVTQIYYVRKIVFVDGLWLSALVGIYFLVQQRAAALKELLGAILYTSGVMLIPFSVRDHVPVAMLWLVAQFAVTAWINLLLFSWMDQPRDEQDTHRSFATAFGNRATRRMLIVLFLVNALLLVIQLQLPGRNAGGTLIITAMDVLLLLIFLRKDFFEAHDRFRFLGDAVFFIPLIGLWL